MAPSVTWPGPPGPGWLAIGHRPWKWIELIGLVGQLSLAEQAARREGLAVWGWQTDIDRRSEEYEPHLTKGIRTLVSIVQQVCCFS